MTMVAEMGEKSKLVAQNANGSASAKSAHLSHEIQDEAKRTVRLRKQPNMDHKPENYDDVRTDYHPAVFSALERFLPPDSLNARREIKLQHMSDVISSYLPRGERMRAQRHCEYRERIIKYYQPRNRELYTLNPDCFFVQSFIDATKENTEESFRRIISEPSPGVYAFSMLQPGFCELLIAEVENFEKWVEITKYKIMRPNTMNKYGAVLDDFGFSPMLDKLMREFVTPMATVLFPALLGSTLDSHHGFVVEYSKDRDLELVLQLAFYESAFQSILAGACCYILVNISSSKLTCFLEEGFHVDDSEVTLNVCLGKQFTGGDLFFKGVRCDNHVNIQNFQEFIV
ncbi:2-oxoglutarate and iron-dependent oxygenase domain-containing protein CP2 isoform X3 [Cryptomeria japonica]|uniref:2-oxoglutarate and iron-dependent oxygenase domain-containing protein CP2 isoform X3 n=1 Tax=Cryptomeria japonica TaxID=3369 RepID=UPI0027DA3DC3|nr:2-oxoglutarate and iron-dependent oxygenase domain-containing protein CP2 isoform X3 [Cryptomeria japonica]